MTKKYYCKTCNKLLDGKKRKFCNKDCQYEFYQKSGGYKKGMNKYMSKPENQEKNRVRANEYSEKKRRENPRDPLYCQIKTCGKLITDLKRTKYCSLECQKEGQRLYMNLHNQKHRKKKYCKECEKLLENNKFDFCSPECKKANNDRYRLEYWRTPKNIIRKAERQRQKIRKGRIEQIKKIKQK